IAQGKARVIVINNSWQLAPWADLLYACDGRWWETYRPEFSGLRVSQDPRAGEFNALRVPSVPEPGLSLDPLRIHRGGNSGYQALNLAVLLGCARVLLVGYDMKGDHWHPPHQDSNPDEGRFACWRQNFATTLP